MLKVALHNLGCKVNSYELDVMQQNLQEKGYIIVRFDEEADIYIVNTCTVTNIADRKSRQMLHQAKKRNSNAVVVAVGCYVQTGMELILVDEVIDLAIGNNKKKDLVPILEEFLLEKGRISRVDKTLHQSSVLNMQEPLEYEEMSLKGTATQTRAYIKIQDGCNQFCAYCIIPFARGRVRSRKSDDILHEVQTLVHNGYKEVVLTGIHISSYGIDFKSQQSGDYKGESYLVDLVEEIHKIKGLERIRLGSLEPRVVTRAAAARLAKLEKLCPHFHLSLQSGCDATLKRMNRRYTTEEFRQSVRNLREVYEMPAITTDVIVGFPGETEEEFEETRNYLEEICLYETHIFKYSRRKGTVADKMEGQIVEKVKSLRSSILSELNAKNKTAYSQQFLGGKVEVLLEEEKQI